MRSALAKVGFRSRLLDNVIDVAACEVYVDYRDEDAVKDVWRGWWVETLLPTGGLEHLLYSCAGIKRSAAILYAYVFSPVWDFGNTTFAHLVEMIIEYALSEGTGKGMRSDDDAFLLPSSHPLMSPLQPTDHKASPELHNFKVLHANVVRTISHATVVSHLGVSEDACEILYHATSWTGAASISNDRALVDCGRPCLDFGKRRSFYVTPTLSTALAWADRNRRRWARECAIVVLAVPRADLRKLSFVAFDAPDEEWVRLTSDSRRCEKLPARNELDRVDFVRGPMVANADDVARHGAAPTTHKHMLWQVAFKSSFAEDLVAGCIAAVIWQSKHTNA